MNKSDNLSLKLQNYEKVSGQTAEIAINSATHMTTHAILVA